MYGRLGASRSRASRRFPYHSDLSPTCHTNGTVRSGAPGSVASVAAAGVVTWRSRRRAGSHASPEAGTPWSIRSAGAPGCIGSSSPGHFSGPRRCGALAKAPLGYASDCHSPLGEVKHHQSPQRFLPAAPSPSGARLRQPGRVRTEAPPRSYRPNRLPVPENGVTPRPRHARIASVDDLETQAWIQHVAETVAEEVDGEHARSDG
jgi:hypothetical protein